MASSMQVQALLANGLGATRMNVQTMSVPRLFGKRVGLRVKCMAEDKPMGSDSNPSTGTPTPTPTPTPQKKAKASFSDVFAFSGPAPERINGRLAMIGFVAAVAVELSKGTDLFSQVSDGGAQWFLGTNILLSIASLIPLFRGENPETKTTGLMNSDAELWNGRLAMLGLVALAFTEYVIGGALV